MTKKFLSISALVLGSSAVLAGCGISSHPTASPSHRTHHHTIAAATPLKTTSTPQGAITPPASASTPTTAPAQSPAPSGRSTAQSLVREWAQASLNGRALGIPYGDQQSYYALEKAWGQGSNGTGVNGTTYVTYAAHDAVVGVNEGVQLVDVRSYNPDLSQITLADIEAVLGKPDAVTQSAGSVIDTYNRGQYRLLWVFSGSASTVNHVDVQWPQGMVAPMAAETTSPSDAFVHFTASGNRIQAGTSTLTVQQGTTVVFSPGNAATSALVNKGDLTLYGGEFLGNSVPAGQVPIALGDLVHGWSYKLPLAGTWRFAIVPSSTVTGNAPVTVTIKVTG